jgi:hypothetical protein
MYFNHTHVLTLNKRVPRFLTSNIAFVRIASQEKKIYYHTLHVTNNKGTRNAKINHTLLRKPGSRNHFAIAWQPMLIESIMGGNTAIEPIF